jgi:hypothetical protein
MFKIVCNFLRNWKFTECDGTFWSPHTLVGW